MLDSANLVEIQQNNRIPNLDQVPRKQIDQIKRKEGKAGGQKLTNNSFMHMDLRGSTADSSSSSLLSPVTPFSRSTGSELAFDDIFLQAFLQPSAR